MACGRRPARAARLGAAGNRYDSRSAASLPRPNSSPAARERAYVNKDSAATMPLAHTASSSPARDVACSAGIKRELRRPSATEPVTGHMNINSHLRRRHWPAFLNRTTNLVAFRKKKKRLVLCQRALDPSAIFFSGYPLR
jgi:hypothetical protein